MLVTSISVVEVRVRVRIIFFPQNSGHMGNTSVVLKSPFYHVDQIPEMLLSNLSTSNFVAKCLMSRAFVAIGGAFLCGGNDDNYPNSTRCNFWTSKSELNQHHSGDRQAIIEEQPRIISGRCRLKIAVPK